MTGHVAQFFLTDSDWQAALGALRAGLRPGGRLAFETRNPGAREGERGTGAHRTRVHDPTVGPIESWLQAHDERDGIVTYTLHYRFSRGDLVTAAGAPTAAAARSCWPRAGCASAPNRSCVGHWVRPASGWSGSTATGTADPPAHEPGS